jgi:hypothetical protein
MAGKQPIEDSGTSSTDVQISSGTWSKANANRHDEKWIVYRRKKITARMI